MIVQKKLTGQSATYFIEKHKILGLFSQYEFGVCSRNLRLKTQNNSSYWTIARQCNIEQVLMDLLQKNKATRIVLQGEIAGEGIQKNKYNIEGYKFFAFNLIIDGKKHRTIEMKNILTEKESPTDNYKKLKHRQLHFFLFLKHCI